MIGGRTGGRTGGMIDGTSVLTERPVPSETMPPHLRMMLVGKGKRVS